MANNAEEGGGLDGGNQSYWRMNHHQSEDRNFNVAPVFREFLKYSLPQFLRADLQGSIFVRCSGMCDETGRGGGGILVHAKLLLSLVQISTPLLPLSELWVSQRTKKERKKFSFLLLHSLPLVENEILDMVEGMQLLFALFLLFEKKSFS